MSNVELSYQELKGLESHFKQIRNKGVVNKLKKAPEVTAEMLRKIIGELGKLHEQSPIHSQSKQLDTDKMRWIEAP